MARHSKVKGHLCSTIETKKSTVLCKFLDKMSIFISLSKYVATNVWLECFYFNPFLTNFYASFLFKLEIDPQEPAKMS
jgi:hypothetical protein